MYTERSGISRFRILDPSSVGIITGMGNPRVSVRVNLGLGYGFDICIQPKPVPQPRVDGFDLDSNSARKTRSTRLNAASWQLQHTRKWAFMLVFECFYLCYHYPSSPPIKWTFPPPQSLKTRQQQGEWVCFTHSPNKVCISFILTMVHYLIIFF